ncbi:hypothetical protein [Roseospira visakhapatnamensis]|uniref:Uncharacterized protein n=1 Tax=Roseospira visakhapatnamensis TaxID=390880 RepID=A0A7W6WA04_9PROT|nr:hypothetical protein [Roseospira visakhapatnamensis]MBB4266358.1 hypothetical protein [Roseospira visakhapatnamensis]
MSRISVSLETRRTVLSVTGVFAVVLTGAVLLATVPDAMGQSDAPGRVPDAAASSDAGSEDTGASGAAAAVPQMQPADTLTAMAGHSTRLGKWHIHRIPDLRLGQPTLDPKSGAIYHPVSVSGTAISFYVIGSGEQELWEVPIIWAGQPTGPRYHKLNYFGILEETGTLYIYSRDTE